MEDKNYIKQQKEQKLWEWGEEEAKLLDSIIDDYEKAAKSFCGYDGKIGLLRAIRDGEYDLPKQEWSEEDERKLQKCIKIVERWEEDYDIAYAPYSNTLKSLRPQPKQEWSEDYDEENLQTRFAFYTYKDEPSTLYLSNVFVEETSRNHGFGTRILKAAEKVAETIGATTIRLKVKQDSPANTWYRKNGYGYVAFEDGYDWLEKNLEYMKSNKQEWSEEDEKIRQSIIKDIEFERNYTFATTGKTIEKYNEQINWLKSLSLNLKKKNEDVAKLCSNEWSEEDEKKITFLERLIRYNVPEGQYGWVDGHKGGFVTKLEAISMLKSLRPQPKAELTLLDKNIIKAAIAFVEQNNHFNCWGGIDKHTVIKALRSLKSSWKPTDEQKYDGNMDKECIKLCDILNSIPSINTFESCCGHLKDRYSIWFFCNDVTTISRLGRCVEHNYSDGKWELLVDSTDTHPTGVFWLRSKVPFQSYDEMEESVNELCVNIQYWFSTKLDSYFNGNSCK